MATRKARAATTEQNGDKLQRALYRIADMASAASDMGEFYAAMHRIVGELMYGDNFYIALYDEDKRIRQLFDAQVVDIGVVDRDAGLIRFPYTIERGVRFPDEPIEIMGFRKAALDEGQTLVVNENVDEMAQRYGQPGALQGEATRSVMFAPLVVGGESTGLISVQNLDHEHAFSKSDVDLLTTLAVARLTLPAAAKPA